MQCPSCHSVDLRRSHSQGWEKAGRILLARKHFRCRACDYRWAQIAFDPHTDKIALAFWAGLISLAGFLLMAVVGLLF